MGFIIWQKLAHLGEHGDGFDIMEEYTRLEDYDVQGYILSQRYKGIKCIFMDAVEQ